MHFNPWIGDCYYSQGLGGARVLVLGESHYGRPEQQTPAFTRQCVEAMAIGANRTRFFTVITKLLLDLPVKARIQDEERLMLWRRIAFHNYVQQFPGTKHREQPTEAMWRDAAACLPATLLSLKPDLIVVLGQRLSARLPDAMPIARCVINHPSSFGFQQIVWRAKVQASLKAVPSHRRRADEPQ